MSLIEREKLIEIINNSGYYLSTEDIADYLLANGVRIQVRCKDCVCAVQDTKYLIRENKYYCLHQEDVHNPEWYCADGERRADNGTD